MEEFTELFALLAHPITLLDNNKSRFHDHERIHKSHNETLLKNHNFLNLISMHCECKKIYITNQSEIMTSMTFKV